MLTHKDSREHFTMGINGERNGLMKSNNGFSLVELLIAMAIFSIVGIVIVTALWVLFGVFQQTDDYMAADQNIEAVFLKLTPQLANVGLGMPRNGLADGESGLSGAFPGSFLPPNAFNDSGAALSVMARMGNHNGSPNWGGSITLGSDDAHLFITVGDPPTGRHQIQTRANIAANLQPSGDRPFVGEELFYAWAVPTGIRLKDWVWPATGSIAKATGSLATNYVNISKDLVAGQPRSANNIVRLAFSSGDVQRLVNFRYDGRQAGQGRLIGIDRTTNATGTRSWILFPSLRIPLLIDNTPTAIDIGNDILETHVAPFSTRSIRGNLADRDEVHLVQVACLFVDDQHRLLRRVYDTPKDFVDETLAENIAAVLFVYFPNARTLTMHIAARGQAAEASARVHGNDATNAWTKLVSGDSYNRKDLTSEDRRYQILYRSMTWRINN